MSRFAAPAPDVAPGCGSRGQNRAAVSALLACLREGRAVHASRHGIVPGDGPWVFCESSGSSGRVKTVRRSQRSWIASFQVNRAFGLSPADHYAVLGDLGHSLALYGAVEALHLGAGLTVLAGDGPRGQLAGLARATVLYATPTQLRRLLLAVRADSLPGMRHVFCGGGKLDAACRAGIAALCPGAAIREFYGASETSFITIADAATPEGSVGRAYPGVALRLDPAGEVWVSSPYLFDGYAGADQPEIRRDGDFVSVGDIGRLDAAGNLFLHGRASRMVTVADRTLFLEDVEAALASAGAGPCAALALPDARRGHAVLAVVEGAGDAARAAALRRACRARLGEHAAPRWVRFLPELPLLASGKPDLRALADLFGA